MDAGRATNRPRTFEKEQPRSAHISGSGPRKVVASRHANCSFSITPQEECKLSNKLSSIVLLYALIIPVTAMPGPQMVAVPEFAGKHFRKMMRGHLETVQEITRLLSEHRYGKAAEVAEEGLGMSSADMHFKMYVGKYLPRDMRAHGEAMHEAATRFARDARGAAKEDELDKALASMADLIKHCSACHSAYRIRESKK